MILHHFYLFFVVLFYFNFITTHEKENSANIKVLILIIAHDTYPIYQEFQKIWRSYMHNYPECVEAYFMKADPNLSVECKIDGDIIWSRGNESIKPGLINKTITSMEHLLPRITKEFDYVLRANLSSFYVIPRLLKFLSNCSKKRFYGGLSFGHNNHTSFASGSGMLLSSDLVELLVNNKAILFNQVYCEDDGLIGHFMKNLGVPVTVHDYWGFFYINNQAVSYDCVEFHPMPNLSTLKDLIPEHIFQFKTKYLIDETLRLTYEVPIHKQLLKDFYEITIT